MGDRITIGCIRLDDDDFISNAVIQGALVELLSKYFCVIDIPATLETLDLEKVEALHPDYVLIDLQNFGYYPFILREKLKLNIKFIVILHTVYYWAGLLVYIIPLLKHADIILAPSDYVRRSILKISPSLEVHVIPYWLDVLAIRQSMHLLMQGLTNDLAFMGRVVPSKGIEELIDCMPEIISKAGQVRLKIIGPLSGGSIKDTCKSPFVLYLEEKVRIMNLAANVEFCGTQLGMEKYRTLATSTLFIYPTRYRGETTGFAIIEALACGLPIVATNFAGIGESVHPGKNGYLIDVNFREGEVPEINKHQLVAAIAGMLLEKEATLHMRRESAAAAMKYDYRQVLPRLMTLLQHHRFDGIETEWEAVEHKEIADFKELFTSEILFFCGQSGAGKRNYSEIIEGLRMPRGIASNNSFQTDENVIRHEEQRLSHGLFRYLCSF